MRTPTSPTLRVPTPEEISSWASSLASRLQDYVRDPEHQVMWGIILLSAALRLSYLDLIPLRAENVEHLQAALNLMGRGQPQEVQVVSPLSDTLPMLHYILGIPLLIGRDPRLIAAFIALLNVAAIAGFYSLVRRYYGVGAGVVSTALFAAAPWAVVFSRRIAAEGLLVPFSVLLVQGCAMALLDDEPVGWSLSAISLLVMLYISLVAIPVTFALIVLIVIYHQRVEWPYLLFGICLASIIFVPYLYEQNLSRFAQLLSLLRELRMRTSVLPAQRGVRVATWLHSGQQLFTLVTPSEEAFRPVDLLSRWVPRLGSLLFVLGLPGTIAMAIHAWSHWKEGEDHAKYIMPAVFLGAPLLATGLQPGPVTPRSLAILYPWGFLAMGLLVDRARGLCSTELLGSFWCSSGLRLGLYMLCLAFIIWNAYAIAYLYGFLPHHDTQEAYGVPYRFWQQTVNLVRREAAEAGGDQVWIIVQGNNSRQVPVAQALSYLTTPNLDTVILPQQEGPSVPLPAARPGVYLFTHRAPLAEDTVQQLDGEERGAVLFPDGHRFRLQVAEEKTAQEIVGAIQERGNWAFGSGLELIGYDWNPQSAALITYWTFSAPLSPACGSEQRLQTCLQTTRGRKIACCSGFGLDERYWQQGLLLKQRCEFGLSENTMPGRYDLLMELQQSRGASGTKEARYIEPYEARLGTVSIAEEHGRP